MTQNNYTLRTYSPKKLIKEIYSHIIEEQEMIGLKILSGIERYRYQNKDLLYMAGTIEISEFIRKNIKGIDKNRIGINIDIEDIDINIRMVDTPTEDDLWDYKIYREIFIETFNELIRTVDKYLKKRKNIVGLIII